MKRFNEWEKRLFTITISLLLFVLVSFAIIAVSIDYIRPISAVLANFFSLLLFIVIVLWIFTIGRIIYYLTKLRKHVDSNGIKRSLVSLIIHPMTIIVLYVIIFLSAVSGCTVN